MPPEEGIFYEPGFITSQGYVLLHQAWELEGEGGKDMCGAGKQGEGRPQGLGFSMRLASWHFLEAQRDIRQDVLPLL